MSEVAPDIIKQRMPTDCAICTIAMATGRPYEEVMTTAALKSEAWHPERGMRAEYKVLEHLGFKQMVNFRVLHRGVTAPEFFLHFTWARPSILAVPSLNIDGRPISFSLLDGECSFRPLYFENIFRLERAAPRRVNSIRSNHHTHPSHRGREGRMRKFRFWLGRELIHLGLRVWPEGRVKREVTQLLDTWRLQVQATLAKQEAKA